MRSSRILLLGRPSIPVLAACLMLSLIAIIAVRDSMQQSSRELAELEEETRLQRLRSSLLISDQQAMDMVFPAIKGSGELRKYAQKALSVNPALRLMISLPDGAAEYRFPSDYGVRNNEAFLKGCEKAGRSRKPELAGPFTMSDGSSAAAIISPVLTAKGAALSVSGYTAALIDLTLMQKEAEFGEITRSGFRYSLYTGEGRDFMLMGGDAPGSISSDEVLSSIDIGGAQWHLKIACPYSTESQFTLLGLLLLFIAGSVLAAMLAGAAKQLAKVNYTDPLTGILNRRGFDRVLERLSRDRRLRKVFVVAVDLNNFKSFNDRYGHAAGDSLLRSFAGELEKLAGKSGRVSRNGGDEFQIFIRNPNDSWLGKLEKFLSVSHFFFHDGNRYWFNASGGAAVYPEMGTDFKQLYIRADAALYHSKANRSGCRLSVFRDEMTQEVREQMGFNFSDLAGGAPAGILICRSDRARKILYANSECQSLMGCSSMNDLMELTGGSAGKLMEDDVSQDEVMAAAGGDAGQDRSQSGFSLCSLRAGSSGERTLFGFCRKATQEYLGDIYCLLLWREADFRRICEGPANMPAAAEPAAPEERQAARQRRRRHPSARKGLQAGARAILQLHKGERSVRISSGNSPRAKPGASGMAGFAEGAACLLGAR